MVWALLVRNPLASALGALFVALGIYTTVLKVDNALLKSQNGILLAAEQRRVMLAESAMRDNAAKEAADKLRLKQTEKERDNALNDLKTAHLATADLQRRINMGLRDRTRSNTMSCPSGEGKGDDTAFVYRSVADILDRTIGEYRSLAEVAEKTRIDLIACSK
jgi:hypothetical protein